VKTLSEIRDELLEQLEDYERPIEVMTGDEAQRLGVGSAVLVYATSLGERIKQPHGAQVKINDRCWMGVSAMPSYLQSNWFYLVLWAKPE
jgi:hypothetical protein